MSEALHTLPMCPLPQSRRSKAPADLPGELCLSNYSTHTAKVALTGRYPTHCILVTILRQRDAQAKPAQAAPQDPTCLWPHGRPAPAAQQRSVSNPAARCPASLPYSVESDDGSGWLLLMGLHGDSWIISHHTCMGASLPVLSFCQHKPY